MKFIKILIIAFILISLISMAYAIKDHKLDKCGKCEEYTFGRCIPIRCTLYCEHGYVKGSCGCKCAGAKNKNI